MLVLVLLVAVHSLVNLQRVFGHNNYITTIMITTLYMQFIDCPCMNALYMLYSCILAVHACSAFHILLTEKIFKSKNFSITALH